MDLWAQATPAARATAAPIRRPIPKGDGEELPVIGLGTARTFDVGAGAPREPLKAVLRRFVELGGRVVDTSPRYGAAETVVGDLAEELGVTDQLFLATKVWTRGERQGVRQMERSAKLLGRPQLDLLQVHDLLDLETHWKTLRAWKEEGRVRYVGVTHHETSAFGDLARVIERPDAEQTLDFVQLNYSVGTPNAEERLLPLAAERRVAVLVNEPFESGRLFRLTRGQPLPAWLGDLGVETWAQLFLKFVVAHPAVTCVLPATSKPGHLEDNMRGGSAPFPSEAERAKMVAYVRGL